MFEIVETTRKLEMQLEAIEYLEQLSQFTFTETSSDVPITYYIAGYASRGLMNHLKCKGCQSIVPDNSCPLTVDIEQITCNDDESQAKDVFLNAINSGGLTKPSDLVFVTCTHSSDLFKAIQNDSFLSQQLINCANSQSLFVEIFLGKLEEVDCTNSVLMVKCIHGHPFSEIVRKIARLMFNLFAKNLSSECNIAIPKKRSRETMNSKKRNPSTMKKKKLTSS